MVKLANGHMAETGCYVDGAWGIYGPHRVCVQAAHILTGKVYEGPADEAAEEWVELADEATADLNAATPDGFVWGWWDGEYFLSPQCENGDCDDPTCLHWDA